MQGQAVDDPALGRVRVETYTPRRLRPFARRALRTFRPPLVAILARKPWVRLRFRLLGWKVLFILSGSLCSGYRPGTSPPASSDGPGGSGGDPAERVRDFMEGAWGCQLIAFS